MRKFNWLLIMLAAVILAGCSGADTTSTDVKKNEDNISKANKEAMEKNPPPPGEGPGN
ncbi:MAG: hypothetical protein K1X67_25190 [Fimbriimonadaceae bacterium]|nr:hypothetical protein [Fimbriimonadaceae bacterium]